MKAAQFLADSLGEEVFSVESNSWLPPSLAEQGATVPNQLKQPTATPTLRWIFQCFQSVHLIQFQSQFSISNLSEQRLWILRFLGSDCQKYYFLC